MDKRVNKSRSFNEKGVAALEMAIILPCLIAILVCAVDVGLLIKEYFVLQEAAALAAEKIQTIPSLSAADCTMSICLNNPQPTPISCPQIERFRNQIEPILKFQSPRNLKDQCYSITPNGNQIRIDITAKFAGELIQLTGHPMRAAAVAPYFYQAAAN